MDTDNSAITPRWQTEEECLVIQEIMRHCQRAVEQQLVTKGNDIRRVRSLTLLVFIIFRGD